MGAVDGHMVVWSETFFTFNYLQSGWAQYMQRPCTVCAHAHTCRCTCTHLWVDVSVCVSVYTYVCYIHTVHVLLGGLLFLLLFCVHTYMQ